MKLGCTNRVMAAAEFLVSALDASVGLGDGPHDQRAYRHGRHSRQGTVHPTLPTAIINARLSRSPTEACGDHEMECLISVSRR